VKLSSAAPKNACKSRPAPVARHSTASAERAALSARRNGLAPAPLGNRRAVTHGAYLTKLSENENAELDALAAEIRAVVPVESPSVEPAVQTLAGLVW
jgi:hypothetical protein